MRGVADARSPRRSSPSCPTSGRPTRAALAAGRARVRALGATLGLDAHRRPSSATANVATSPGSSPGCGAGEPGVPVLPAGAPFAPTTPLWVDGLLAGHVLARRRGRPEPPRRRPDAPTARARSSCCGRRRRATPRSWRRPLAERLAGAGHRAALVAHGRLPSPADLADAAPTSLVVTSTFGDGDAARQRHRVLGRRWPRPTRAGSTASRFAVLALGDSSYDRLLRARSPPRRTGSTSSGRDAAGCRASTASRTTTTAAHALARRRSASALHGRRPTPRRRRRRRTRPAVPGEPARRRPRGQHARRSPGSPGTGCSALPGRGQGGARVLLRHRAARAARLRGRRRARRAAGQLPRPRRRVARASPGCDPRRRSSTSTASATSAARRAAPPPRHHPDHARPARASSPNGRRTASCASCCARTTASDLARWTWGRQAVDVVAELAPGVPRRGLVGVLQAARSRGCTRSRRARCVDPTGSR